MNFQSLINSLQYIKPEIVIAVVIVLIVTTDLIMGKNKSLLPWISIAGLIVASFFVIEQFSFKAVSSSTDGSIGMITADPFGAFFKIIVILSSIIIVFFSLSSN